MSKIGPNEPCPCGSGKKFKKCCRDAMTAVHYDVRDRMAAYVKLEELLEDEYGAEDDLAYDDFWDEFLDRADELPPEMARALDEVYDAWFTFDREDEHGKRVVDALLTRREDLTAGERVFLQAMRESTLHVYDVADVVPGVSLTLRDVLEGGTVTVHERSGSRTIPRHTLLAARVVPRGASGKPEMEAGVLHLSELLRDALLAELTQIRATYLRHPKGDGLRRFYEAEVPPLVHRAWLGSVFDPPIPRVRNTDGEEVVETTVSFDVNDADALRGALDAHDALERGEGETWTWSGPNAKGELTVLGALRLADGSLALACNSVERGTRGRALLEAIGAAAVRHRATVHEDVHAKTQAMLTAIALGQERPPSERDRPDALPVEVADALAAQHYGMHYRAWVDEPVPAVDGLTPRAAAKRPDLRERVIELLYGLEGMYERALREGQPAYDPSWMWAELGLEDGSKVPHPPALAHERVGAAIAGLEALVAAIADRVRGASDDPRHHLYSAADAEHDLEAQRFLRVARSANDSGSEPAVSRPYLRLMVNHELHRRKTFWVDASLAYMLGHTELDVLGRELRAPFASFALVFTDRHVLSLLERVLSREPACPLAGYILRVATVYVREVREGEERSLELQFACDALGADLPHLLSFVLPLPEERQVAATVDALVPRAIASTDAPDMNPRRGLLRVAINAILYTTSAGVSHVPRTAPPKPRASGPRGPAPAFSADDVYFLPGTIDITNVRRMQELERAPQGREMLRRYMVRGHFRRPARNWSDQTLRWIEPYWKGPDMAAVIERAYRLKPS
jgi:hypothetical protein